MTDLPGIYSLSPYSSEEIVTRDFLIGEKPSGIINIVDASNLERNLCPVSYTHLDVYKRQMYRPVGRNINEKGILDEKDISESVPLWRRACKVRDVYKRQNIDREIRTITSQKKVEGRLISAMPLIMLMMLNIFSFSYIEPLYTTMQGRICLLYTSRCV